tara:strand:+ start:147 stop:272 length:126 start_codon:yes stop_codon:yes gene_type:complete
MVKRVRLCYKVDWISFRKNGFSQMNGSGFVNCPDPAYFKYI